MIFDKERIVVEVGKLVEFWFLNIDVMLYNFVIVMFGLFVEVGELGEVIGWDVDVEGWGYIFDFLKILMVSCFL